MHTHQLLVQAQLQGTSGRTRREFARGHSTEMWTQSAGAVLAVHAAVAVGFCRGAPNTELDADCRRCTGCQGCGVSPRICPGWGQARGLTADEVRHSNRCARKKRAATKGSPVVVLLTGAEFSCHNTLFKPVAPPESELLTHGACSTRSTNRRLTLNPVCHPSSPPHTP